LAIDKRNEGNIRSAVVWFEKAIAMKDGEACIELAKIYTARKGGQSAAARLLRRALRLNRDCISEAGREAELLLNGIRG
jgi:TPR repeat protein